MTARHLQRSAIFATSACCLAVLLFAASGADPAFAYWTWSSTTRMTINVARPSSSLSFEVGKSKATWTHTGKPPHIASIDPASGRISLDFGDVGQKNRNNSPEVLLVTNTSGAPCTLRVVMSDSIRPLFTWADLEPGSLRPGRTAALGMKLSGMAAEGVDYAGTLDIVDESGHVLATMVVRLRLKGVLRLDRPEDPCGRHTASEDHSEESGDHHDDEARGGKGRSHGPVESSQGAPNAPSNVATEGAWVTPELSSPLTRTPEPDPAAALPPVAGPVFDDEGRTAPDAEQPPSVETSASIETTLMALPSGEATRTVGATPL